MRKSTDVQNDVSESDASLHTNKETEAVIAAGSRFISDILTGQRVRATPEEVHAVQPFLKALLEDYGYPKNNLRARPQWRVKARPSDRRREYPVDIAIFSEEDHREDTLFAVVECKRRNRTDGRSQLEDYMRLSSARVGVWFNGEERLFIKKVEQKGRVSFVEIPNLPRFGQRLEDVGLYLRRSLRPTQNLRSVFRAIRHYLAANAVGATRDEVFAQQIINLLFCKIYDERFTRPDHIVEFRAGIDEPFDDVKRRIVELFDKVKDKYRDVMDRDDSIKLDARSITYIVGELAPYEITATDRDVVADAFEVFIGPSLKGSQGQFFTPRNVVKMVVDMIDPKVDETVIDPACGSGGFLVEALRHIWRRVEEQGSLLGWPEQEIISEKQEAAIKNLRGIDKDSFLAKVAKAYMAILGDGRGGVFCENSLDSPSNWARKAQDQVRLHSFDVVITNPPFGKKLAVDNASILERYDLGHEWRRADDVFEKGSVLDKQSPQILFVERCLQLLKPGGRLGIVLLESIFGMPKYRYIVDYLARRTTIKAIVTLPEDLFQPYTHAKTCVLIAENTVAKEDHDIFMCDVKWCGHDSRGNATLRVLPDGSVQLMDDIPKVAALYQGEK